MSQPAGLASPGPATPRQATVIWTQPQAPAADPGLLHSPEGSPAGRQPLPELRVALGGLAPWGLGEFMELPLRHVALSWQHPLPASPQPETGWGPSGMLLSEGQVSCSRSSGGAFVPWLGRPTCGPWK